jgi:hypothetical protein
MSVTSNPLPFSISFTKIQEGRITLACQQMLKQQKSSTGKPFQESNSRRKLFTWKVEMALTADQVFLRYLEKISISSHRGPVRGFAGIHEEHGLLYTNYLVSLF